MIWYRCEKEELEVKSSICPHCGGRAYPQKSEIYWCACCQVPTYEKDCPVCGQEGKKIATDVRPVFPQERLLLEAILEQQKGCMEVNLEGKAIWNGTGNYYYADGNRLDVKISKLAELSVEKVRIRYEEKCREKLVAYEKIFEQECAKFVAANESHLQQIEFDALSYIKSLEETYSVKDMMISFSGGKDSTVVADLVTRALGDGNRKILHIFGDTTLEFPMTYEYVNRYKANHRQTPVLSSRNKDKDFFELCEQIGPPSRVMRWCCTIFKTGAITRKIEKVVGKKSHIVTFYGIRRSESASRSKYERESQSPKITKQTVVSPIIDWYDFDVWLYLIGRKVDFNDAYRLGYARVGCWCCPNNSRWSEFLSKLHMPEQYGIFRAQLIAFAKKIGKPDAEKYVDEGKWKARQGGNGVEMAQKSVISFAPCATEENAFNYELQRPISEEFYELFKPFGTLDHQMGNKKLGEVFVLDRMGQPLLKLQGRVGTKKLKVTIYQNRLAGAKSLKGAEEKIKCQLTKYQMCMGCLACEGVCRFDAISIREKDGEVSYQIDETKCKQCGECVGHFIAGCYMRKVLAIKR